MLSFCMMKISHAVVHLAPSSYAGRRVLALGAARRHLSSKSRSGRIQNTLRCFCSSGRGRGSLGTCMPQNEHDPEESVAGPVTSTSSMCRLADPRAITYPLRVVVTTTGTTMAMMSIIRRIIIHHMSLCEQRCSLRARCRFLTPCLTDFRVP